jgi:hypothetical protein
MTAGLDTTRPARVTVLIAGAAAPGEGGVPG